MKKEACPVSLPRTEEPASYCATTGVGPGPGPCHSDAECTEHPLGHCEASGVIGCSCRYGCVQDSDCGEGQICFCGYPTGQCVSAKCTLDSECLPGFDCLSYGHSGCGGTQFACQVGSDACVTNAECGDGAYCAWSPEGRQCQQWSCPAGG